MAKKEGAEGGRVQSRGRKREEVRKMIAITRKERKGRGIEDKNILEKSNLNIDISKNVGYK